MELQKKKKEETEDFIRKNSGNTEAFQNNCIAYDNSVEIEGNTDTRQAMVNVAIQDNGNGGSSEANNKEYVASISYEGTVTPGNPGPVVRPGPGVSSNTVDINLNDNTKSVMHTHQSGSTQMEIKDASNKSSIPSGSATQGYSNSQSVITYSMFNAPSYSLTNPNTDINPTRTSRTNYEFARGEGKVYIYNTNSGVQATLPQRRFVNFRR